MGGRRAVSLRDVLGSARTYPKLEHELDVGLESKDPQAISRAASRLATKVISPSELTSHFRLLVPFVEKTLKSRDDQLDLRSAVRREWARIKRVRGIRVTPAVNDSLVQAVIDLLKARS